MFNSVRFKSAFITATVLAVIFFITYALVIFKIDNYYGNLLYEGQSNLQQAETAEAQWSEVKSIISFWIWFCFGAVTAVCVIVVYFVEHARARFLNRLTQYAAAIERGELEERRIESNSKDEFGRFVKSFSSMASVIVKSINELGQEKNKLEAVLQYMTDGVIAFSSEGQVIHINAVAQKMLEIDDCSHISFDEFFKQHNVEICIAELIYLDYINTITREMYVGDTIFRVFFTPLAIERVRSGGVVVVLQDITEVEKMEKLRREFVANVSHELRTPLTTVKSYAETLLDGGLDDDKEIAVNFLNIINNEVDRMTRLVKDLLTLTTLGAGVVQRTKTYFDLDELLREIVNKMGESVSDTHIISYERATSLPKLCADRDKIEQVVTNIVANSIKYTTAENGIVEVCTGHVYNEVYIKIKDNGIGISNKDLPRVFERFYRVDKARSRDKGGTGLGLAIANEIIKLHDGSITITSKLEVGTEVLIKLPVMENAG